VRFGDLMKDASEALRRAQAAGGDRMVTTAQARGDVL
jgi:hypothetical protein